LGEAFNQTVEDKGSDLFNDIGSGATYLAEDSLSIANNSHINASGGNSQDNNYTNSLNMTGIKTCRTAMRKFTNYSGDSKSKIQPDGLVVPVDLEEDAWEVVNSIGRPDNANRASNMYNGKFKLYVWDELTDTNAWFMVDTRKMKQNLMFLWRDPFELAGDGDLQAGTHQITAYCRFSLGCLDWRWVGFNNPS
jgi:hypothetical protein